MTPKQSRSGRGRHQAGPHHTPRLRLKPKALPTGYVDGAWWPQSDDLAAELPDLLAVLSVRLGPIGRVAYQRGAWSKAPATTRFSGKSVQLTGSRRQPPSTVEILGTGGTSIMLLVVPPGADPDRAHDTMMAAAQPDNNSTTTGLLALRSH